MRKIAVISLIVLAIAFVAACKKGMVESNNVKGHPILTTAQLTRAEGNYSNYCSSCHGVQMQAFVDRTWKYGQTKADIIKAVKYGYPDGGMPAYEETFTDEEIEELAVYIVEGLKTMDRYAFQDKPITSDTFVTASVTFRLDTVATGMQSPWGMTFLPNGDLLVTEKFGTLFRVKPNGEKTAIKGTPEVNSEGQGGLLDIELHPKFTENNVIYLSYSKINNEDKSLATTAIMRAKLDGDNLTEQKDIFVALPYFKTRHHYGSRLEFDREGYLFFSVGDRGRQDENPQNLGSHCGKIHRINDDGTIPTDNPFVNTPGAMPSIYSYGHRNPQGVAMNPMTGEMWAHEHGPRGGDELNRIKKGANYGWPVISYGINYNGTTFTNITEKEGMEQPITYWVPSIAPCGMTFATTNRYGKWENNILLGSLRYKYLNLCRLDNEKVSSQELLLQNIGRMRSVEVSPDGYIYVSVENPGIVYRLLPLEG